MTVLEELQLILDYAEQENNPRPDLFALDLRNYNRFCKETGAVGHTMHLQVWNGKKVIFDPYLPDDSVVPFVLAT